MHRCATVRSGVSRRLLQGGAMAALCITSVLGVAASAADGPIRPEPLRLDRDGNWLIIRSPQLPRGEIRINYLEAYCRPDSTDADWVEHTLVGHRTELVELTGDGQRMRLRCHVQDGLRVEHDIRVVDDGVSFHLTVTNTADRLNEAHWAQPCVRLGDFAGAETDDPRCPDIKLSNSFIFLDGRLSRLPTQPWATEARYVPGQVWVPRSVPRTDVNPRPLSELVPSNGLIGCFSQDGRWLLAIAFEPYQELFQGVARCLHSDFRIGDVQPGETKEIRGKIYLLCNDPDLLLRRYHRDFPEDR